MDYHQLDDAAQAALWALRSAPTEYIGALFQANERIAHTTAGTSRSDKNAVGTVRIPLGSLRGLFHNHPRIDVDHRNKQRTMGGGENFSRSDIQQAKNLGVPSYVQTPEGRLMRYDPNTRETADVLAELPIAEIHTYLMQLLGRGLNDPRGAYHELP